MQRKSPHFLDILAPKLEDVQSKRLEQAHPFFETTMSRASARATGRHRNKFVHHPLFLIPVFEYLTWNRLAQIHLGGKK